MVYKKEHLKRKTKGTFWGQSNLFLMCLALPMFLYKLIIHYIPMAGIVLAFKNYKLNLSIWESPWAGLKNFEFFFRSPDALRTARNTLAYSGIQIIIGTLGALAVALLLYELQSRFLVKYIQTVMLFPHFMSWVIVAFVVYGFLNYEAGILNRVIEGFGMERINWYAEEKAWMFIIPTAQAWKHIGMGTLMYYASLMGIDPSYYEAAEIEGANRFQIMTKIKLPFLYPLVIMLSILAIGRIFNADFGLFYQLPKGSTMVYETTDVIETYVFRALREQGNFALSAAVSLYKSLVGFILVITTNKIVKKLSPENALF